MKPLREDEIAQKLADSLPPPSPDDCQAGWLSALPQPAAVLIPFLWRDEAWHLLFTRRTDRVEHHKGQVSFPGGRCDPEDETPEATALREAYEEIGLLPGDVHILGRLKAFPTISNYCITPVIGRIPWPYALRLAEIEVSRAFTIPLGWLAKPGRRATRRRIIPGSLIPQPVIYFEPYDGETLWGISAQITVNLLETLGL